MNIATLWNKGIAGKLAVLSIASLGCCISSAVVSAIGRPSASRSQTFIAPTWTPVSVETPQLAPTPTMAPTVEAIAQMICGKDYVGVAHIDGGSTVSCRFNPPINDETMAVGVMMDFKSLAQRSWEINPNLTFLRYQLTTVMQDKTGNEYETVTIELGMSKELADSINWKNISHRALPALLAEDKSLSSVWVHPVFMESWLTMAINQ